MKLNWKVRFRNKTYGFIACQLTNGTFFCIIGWDIPQHYLWRNKYGISNPGI